ncbi:hypothetical protein GCM10027343_05930 [Noviherbaspirillum agri]
MGTKQEPPKGTEKADPTAVRTRDNPLGTDDIGLPAEPQPDEVRKPEDVRPDPERAGR